MDDIAFLRNVREIMKHQDWCALIYQAGDCNCGHEHRAMVILALARDLDQ